MWLYGIQHPQHTQLGRLGRVRWVGQLAGQRSWLQILTPSCAWEGWEEPTKPRPLLVPICEKFHHLSILPPPIGGAPKGTTHNLGPLLAHPDRIGPNPFPLQLQGPPAQWAPLPRAPDRWRSKGTHPPLWALRAQPLAPSKLGVHSGHAPTGFGHLYSWARIVPSPRPHLAHLCSGRGGVGAGDCEGPNSIS